MKNNVLLWAALALGLGGHSAASAQSAAAKDASSAEEVLGPVNAQVPMQSTPPPAAARPATPPMTPPPAANQPVATPPVTTQPAEAQPVAEEEIPLVDEADARRRARRGVGVALRLSILQGFGIEGIYSLSEHFNVRGQFNYLNLTRDLNQNGVDYNARVKLQSIGALIDYHPFAGSFRFSLGLYNDGNKISANATCKTGSSCDVGDVTITSNTNGSPDPHVAAGIDMKRSVAPYFGFGWGNAMKGWPVHFGFDIGVMYQGSPGVALAASGTGNVTDKNTGFTRSNVDLSSDPAVQTSVAKERADLQDTVSKYKLWPAIAFTLGYRFGS